LGPYQWLLLASTFLVGLVAGVGTVTLLASNPTGKPSNETLAHVSPSAESRPASATETEVASLSPLPSTPAVPATTVVASVCGETARVTAPGPIPLMRTEGVTVFSVENTNGGVLDNKVRALATDRKGRLWVATETRGVAMFDGTSWHTYSTEEGLPINSTFGLTIDKDDNAWVATLEGVAKYDAARDKWSTIYTVEHYLHRRKPNYCLQQHSRHSLR
jgi:hypothetical protein